MGRMIIKVKKDEDLYMQWSSVVDNAVFTGSADELVHEYGEEALSWIGRANKFGSSSRPSSPSGPGCWEDDGLIVTNVDTREDGSFFWLPRDRFAGYARLLNTDETTAAEALLIPLELGEV